MANKLDLDKDIVNETKKATPYMEDIISQIVDDLGGESAPTVADQITAMAIPGFVTLAQLKRLRM